MEDILIRKNPARKSRAGFFTIIIVACITQHSAGNPMQYTKPNKMQVPPYYTKHPIQYSESNTMQVIQGDTIHATLFNTGGLMRCR
jgi:hypothetical protein